MHPYRERERERFSYFLVHSPNDWNNQDWARQEPGNPFEFPMDGWGPSTEAISHCLPRVWALLLITTCCATMPYPERPFWNSGKCIWWSPIINMPLRNRWGLVFLRQIFSFQYLPCYSSCVEEIKMKGIDVVIHLLFLGSTWVSSCFPTSGRIQHEPCVEKQREILLCSLQHRSLGTVAKKPHQSAR